MKSSQDSVEGNVHQYLGPVHGDSKEKVLIIVQPLSEQEKSVMNFGTTFGISFWNLRWSR